ncbi:hypothetical protein GN244_ATG05677 [Phytophthora infestans]|uniref:Uncharacterized protein n=1 Tax=Phytophthora infestans TaxID=4787 RepID=A0A833WMK1_PHYIN|nr:hypothetical protein GN244_ATG05677 [Phytophthora infestans]
MRWYCVHPNLPLQAELRIRAAPDSGAAERARISQGRAIAACSPLFQVTGDGGDDAAISWLQVVCRDAVTGETEEGFMMAVLPDGTPLVIPWESTNFYSCCEATNSAVLLYDGPHETANSLGPVQSVNFLYCIADDSEKRSRIFHPELESVWIEKKDLQIVCTRFKHEECNTPHTFYELSEALPEEAQIAIRDYPAKEAQAVGLLSRGQTVEVTVRGGNWLLIAGGSVDKAWIMWRTDALELLQEAPDVWSSTCERRAKTVNSLTGNKSVAQAENDDNNQFASALASVSGQDDAINDAAPGSWCDRDDRPIHPATHLIKKPTIEEQADAEVVGNHGAAVPGDVGTDHDTAHAEVAAGITPSDERPIRPARNIVDEEDSAASVGVVEEDCAGVCAGAGADDSASKPEVDERMERSDAVSYSEDRPIRPAIIKEPAIEEQADAEVVGNHGAAVSGNVGTDHDTARAEVAASNTSSDERPIRPARNIVNEEDSTASVGVVEEDCAGVCAGAGADDSASKPEVDERMERSDAVSYSEDRPIRPAIIKEPAIEEQADAEVVRNHGAAVPGDVGTDHDTAHAEVAAGITPSDGVVEEDCAGVCAGAGADDSASKPEVDERMERSDAVSYSEDRPIRPAIIKEPAIEEQADAEVVGNHGAAVPGDVGTDHDTAHAEVAAGITPSDERPIRPARNIVDEEDSAASVGVMEEDCAGVCGAGADDSASKPEVDERMERSDAVSYSEDRPIRPAIIKEPAIEEQADAEVVGNHGAAVPGDVGTDHDTAHAEVAAGITPSDGVVEKDCTGVCAGAGADDSASKPEVDERMERSDAVSYSEDRPIRPAIIKEPAIEEQADAEVVGNHGAAVPGDVGTDHDTAHAEVAAGITPSDERPIRPARNIVDEEDSAASVGVVEEDCAGVCAGAGADDSASKPEVDERMERSDAVSYSEDRPIRPAIIKEPAIEEQADAEVVGNHGAAVPGDVGTDHDTAHAEVAAGITPSDERPIRPARNIVDEEDSTASVGVVEEDCAGVCAGAGADDSASKPEVDERMERSDAVSYSEDRPIRPAIIKEPAIEEQADAEVVGNHGAAVPGNVGTDHDTARAEVAASNTSSDERPIRPARNIVDEEDSAASVGVVEEDCAGVCAGAGADDSASKLEVDERMERSDAVSYSEDRPIRPAIIKEPAIEEQADAEVVGNHGAAVPGDVGTDHDTAHAEVAAGITPSDERPIRPARNIVDEEDSTASVGVVEEDCAGVCAGAGADDSASKPEVDERMERSDAVSYSEDRPIRPAIIKEPAIEEQADAEVVGNHGAAVPGNVGTDHDTARAEVAASNTSSDERPIRPARNIVDEEDSAASVGVVEEDCAGVCAGAGADDSASKLEVDERMERSDAVSYSEDRPIRPAIIKEPAIEEQADAEVVGNHGAAVPGNVGTDHDTARAEVAASNTSSDERPIRPARNIVDEEDSTASVGVVEEDCAGVCAGAGADDSASKPEVDERMERSDAVSYSEDRPIRPAIIKEPAIEEQADAEVVGNHGAAVPGDVGTDHDTAHAEVAAGITPSDGVVEKDCTGVCAGAGADDSASKPEVDERMERSDAVSYSEDRPIRPAIIKEPAIEEQADAEVVGNHGAAVPGDVGTDHDTAHAEVAAGITPSDERPIRPARNIVDEEDSAASVGVVEEDCAGVCAGAGADDSASKLEVDERMERSDAVSYSEDRPIRPAIIKEPAIEEQADAEVVGNHGAAVPGNVGTDHDTARAEVAASNTSSDERPIRPARNIVDEEDSTASVGVVEEDCAGVCAGAGADDSASKPEVDERMERSDAVSYSEDRPIRPAIIKEPAIEEQADAEVVGNHGAAVPGNVGTDHDTARAEVAASNTSSDERSIRPARNIVNEEDSAASVGVVEEDCAGVCAGAGADDSASKPEVDERMERSDAVSYSEDRPIRPAIIKEPAIEEQADAEVVGNHGAAVPGDVGTDHDTAHAEVAAGITPSDERSIRPARNIVDEEDSAASVGVVEEDCAGVCAGVRCR